MGKETKIAWCDATWNPWMGCTKVAPECANCYAERDMLRWGKDPRKVVRAKDATFYAPLGWKEPKRVFACSWSDFFHEDADPMWRHDAWDVMWEANWHTYIVLTKRPQNIAAMLPPEHIDGWPAFYKHVWFLVSAGTNESLTKFWPILHDTPNLAVRGISMEPLLEDIYWPFFLPDWVIVGGESGPKRRPMDITWARRIRDECALSTIPFFYKGLVGNIHTPENEMLDGKVYHEFPERKTQ